MAEEHVERQEERENEIKASADELDEQGDKLEERGEEVEQQIGETRQEWEQKQRSEDVPGAQSEDEMYEGVESPDADADSEDDDDDNEGDEQSGAPIEENE